MTGDPTLNSDRADVTGRQDERGFGGTVTMVSTPGDGSCGIGTYTRDLLDGIGPLAAELVDIPQDDLSFRAFLGLALRVVRTDGEVIHVQHEYGLFRREGNRYPGVMGLVFFPLLFLTARLQSRTVVVTMHSVLTPDPAEAGFPVRVYLLLMHKLLASGAAHIVFLSPDCAERFLSEIDLRPSAYSCLSHGVKTDLPAVSREAAKRQFGFDPADDVVAIPGFVRPPKGYDVFLEVARRLPDREFLVAGGARPKGDDFAFAARVEAEAPENVTVTGVLDDDDYWTALAAPDLVLLPYRVVTQSGTFNSCASRGLPMLASDVPYFRRIQAKWGAPATVDVDDTDAVVERVRELLADGSQRRRLSAAIRQYRRANSFEQVGAEHLGIYRHVRDGTVAALGDRDARVAADPEPDSPMLAACSAQQPVSTD